MKNYSDIQKTLSENKELIFHRFPLLEMGIFGSFVKNEQTENSDLDILIDYDKKKKFSLLDVSCLQKYLSELLGMNVDIALKSSLKPAIGYYVLKEVKYI